MIQLHRFEGFYWVAKVGGYARAARAFPYPITQPAVHQQVSKLEAELGQELFERVGKDKMRLTAAGERLFRFVAPFFEGLPSVVRAVKAGDYGGTLVIHAAPMLVRNVMPKWLERMLARKPEARIELLEMRQTDLARLRDGAADVLVDYLPQWPDDVATMEIGALRGFVVLPSKHPLARKSKPSLAQLAGADFISYTPGGVAYELQTRALAEHGLTPREVVTASTADSILALVAQGLGFSLIPWHDSAGPKLAGVTSFPIWEREVRFPYVAAWRKDTPENPLLDALLESAPKA